MDNNQLEFLRVLKDYIHQNKGEYMVTPEMLLYAKSQELEGIVYKQTKIQTLQSKYAFSLYMYENRNYIISALKKRLEMIPHFFVKGIILAGYYPDPSTRTMGDVDLVVQENNIPKVKEIFTELGFNISGQFETVTIAEKNRVEFEIHTSLIHSGIGNTEAATYFSKCWDYVNDNILDKNYHFIFAMQHLKGHLISEGIGFRQFIDIALFSQDPELNWAWIVKQLHKMGLINFANCVFSFNKKWFEVEPPIPVSEIDNDFFVEATEKIFVGGVFGHEDINNRNTDIVKQAVSGEIELAKAQQQFFLKQIFPEYEKMCKHSYCSYIRKSKALLPIAWVHRALYRGFDRKRREGLINRTTMNESLQQRHVFLKKWGL